MSYAYDAQGRRKRKTVNGITTLDVTDADNREVLEYDGTKVKGYVYSAGDEDFVIRDRKTDAPTTVRYADVKKIDDNRGHSLARNILIAVGIGAAVTLTAVYLAIVRNKR